MTKIIKLTLTHLNNELVADDTAGMIAFLDGQDRVKPGPMGCVGYCMSGPYVTTAAGLFPHRMRACASLYGVLIVTDQPDSSHLVLKDAKAEMYYGFAEIDELIPDFVLPKLKTALDEAKLKYTLDIHKGMKHGFCFPEKPVFNAVAADEVWHKVLAMWERNLKK